MLKHNQKYWFITRQIKWLCIPLPFTKLWRVSSESPRILKMRLYKGKRRVGGPKRVRGSSPLSSTLLNYWHCCHSQPALSVRVGSFYPRANPCIWGLFHWKGLNPLGLFYPSLGGSTQFFPKTILLRRNRLKKQVFPRTRVCSEKCVT